MMFTSLQESKIINRDVGEVSFSYMFINSYDEPPCGYVVRIVEDKNLVPINVYIIIESSFAEEAELFSQDLKKKNTKTIHCDVGEVSFSFVIKNW